MGEGGWEMEEEGWVIEEGREKGRDRVSKCQGENRSTV
jgi:hypothetical protein